MFYLIGSMASAFSGILAFGFTKMNGLGNLGSVAYSQHYVPTEEDPTIIPHHDSGIAGWRWIVREPQSYPTVLGVLLT